MKVTGKHTAQAHLWLYESGIDPDDRDVTGLDLASSLAEALARAEREGRIAAASHFLKERGSGEFTASVTTTAKPSADAEATGKYDTRVLDELLQRSAVNE
jgi:hypothetical protein